MPVRKWGSERVVGTTDAMAGDKEADVAGLADGGYVVVWEDASETQRVLAQRFDAAGNAVGAQIVVTSSSEPAGTEYSQPQVAALENGGFAITYTASSGNNNVWMNQYTAGGVFSSGQGFISGTASENQGAVTSFGTGVRWAYQYDGDIRIGFNTVNDDVTAGTQTDATIAEIGSNRYVVTWVDLNGGYNIRYRVFESNGTAVTASLQANNTSNVADPHAAGVIGLADGRFVIAWGELSSSLQDLQGYSVHAQIYNADGVQVGGEFVVNSTFKNYQAFPELVALPDGGFVAVWSDSSAGAGSLDYNIVGQVFNAFGARVGGQFTVNTGTDGTAGQFFPHVAALADGRLVVEWHSAATGEIRTQIVDPRDGIVTGTENAETLYGHSQVADEINGLGGADTLDGLAGDDALYGGDGNDVLRGGAGADELDGGAGTDTASYVTSAGAVTISLLAGTAAGGDAAGDHLTAVESVTGSALADTLTGDGNANTLSGEGGNDILAGGTGSDVLRGGAGADRLDGGAGVDSAMYSESAAGVTVNLTAGTGIGGNAQGDILISIETVYGSALADTLTGSAANDSLVGGAGNDVVTGLGGRDTLYGGTGADRFVFTAPADSPAAGGDLIKDFSFADADRIDLSAIDANSAAAGNQAFTFIGVAAFSGVAGQLRVATAGGITTVTGDLNGDKVADVSIDLTGSLALAAADFVL